MKVQIQRHVTTADYAHYPGQVMIDHPDEEKWLAAGDAIPVVEEPELAVAATSEIRNKRK